MWTDKKANHRYRIDKPCNGGTQLQELHCEQTVRRSWALLSWEMQMSSLPNEGQAQRWVAWRRQDCGPRGLCKTAWSKLNPSDYYFGCFQPMVTWRYEEFKTVRVVLTTSPTYDFCITRSAVFNRWWLGDIWEKKSERRLTKVGHYVVFM